MKNSITFDETDEETLRIFVNKACVGCFDHDEHGYHAMSDVKDLMNNIAIQLDITVEQKP